MRIQLVKQIEARVRVEDVVSGLGLSRSALFAWVAAYLGSGIKALRAKPDRGRPPKLSGFHLRTLSTLVDGSDP